MKKKKERRYHCIKCGAWKFAVESPKCCGYPMGDHPDSFAENLLSNTVDLEPEYSKVIDDNYWNLI